MKVYATVCKQLVAQGAPRPLRVSLGKRGKPRYARALKVPRGARNVKVCYDPGNPLPWGAKAWVEWDA